MPSVRPRPKRKPPCAKLFWCSTADHDEDWFVVASSELAACRQQRCELRQVRVCGHRNILGAGAP